MVKQHSMGSVNVYLLEKGISEVRLILFLFLSRATLFPKFPVFPFTLILSWRNFSCERRKANPTGLGKVTLTLTREENPSPTCISTSQSKSKPLFQDLDFAVCASLTNNSKQIHSQSLNIKLWNLIPKSFLLICCKEIDTYKVANIHDSIFHWMSAVNGVTQTGLLLFALSCRLGLARSLDVLQHKIYH